MLREVPRMVKHHPHEQTMHLPVFLVGAHCQLRLFARRQSALIAHGALHKTGTAALLMLHRAYVPEQIRARFARIGRITGHPEPTPKTEGAYATWGEKTSKVRIADNPPGTTR
jgi:hypothetical protein